MGLFDSLKKKLTGAAEKSSNLIRGASENAGTIRTELSFNDVLEDIALHCQQKTSSPEELYKKAMDCAGVKEVDGLATTQNPEKFGKQDLNQAIKYAEESYKAGFNKAAHLLASLYSAKACAENRNDDIKLLTILNEGVEKGDTASMRVLATIYYYGQKGVKSDTGKAKELLNMATQYGDPYAYAEYAQFCFLENDIQQGLEYLEEALTVNSALANYTMGDMYSRGAGVPMNPQKAIAFFTKAAEMGRVDCYGRIGILYAQTDPVKAMKYYKKGAELGDAYSSWLYAQTLPNNDSQRYKYLKYAHASGISLCMFTCTDPTAPFYTYQCKMGSTTILVKSQNPSKPSQEEVAEAYAANCGKMLAMSMLNSAIYTRL